MDDGEAHSRILFGLGYQGREVSGLIDALAAAGVSTVVDIRLNPVSRRPGFSKGPLSRALADAGIAYVHERDLGNPSANRSALASADPERARRVLRDRLCGEGAGAMDRLVALAALAPVAALCLERSPEHCHRAVVLERARELDPDLEIRDIP